MMLQASWGVSCKKEQYEEGKGFHLAALGGEEEGAWRGAQGHPHFAE